MSPVAMGGTAIGEDDLLALCRRAIGAHGVSAEDAQRAARILVLAEMMEVRTHGVARVLNYCDRLATGAVDASASVAAETIAPALIKVDGRNGLGPAVAMWGVEAAMEAAATTGVAVAFCRQSNHFGAAAPYCWLAAEAGYSAIVMSNSAPMMAPPGLTRPVAGNNPIGFGFPSPAGNHLIFDMALSVAARSHIRNAEKAGERIPDNWATDAEGVPTTDPARAMLGQLLPIGGYKGFGLALCVDMFAGLLSGGTFLSDIPDLARTPDAENGLGQAIFVVDVRRLMPEAELTERMAHMRDLASGGGSARLPGDRALAAMTRARAKGIMVKPDVLSAIRGMAGASS